MRGGGVVAGVGLAESGVGMEGRGLVWEDIGREGRRCLEETAAAAGGVVLAWVSWLVVKMEVVDILVVGNDLVNVGRSNAGWDDVAQGTDAARVADVAVFEVEALEVDHSSRCKVEERLDAVAADLVGEKGRSESRCSILARP